MQSLSFRTKIFCSMLVLTLLALALPLMYARTTLHNDLLMNARQQALREARLAALVLDAIPSTAAYGNYVAKMQNDAWRLTIIAPDGRVLADSRLDAHNIAQLDNHADRPEIIEALQSGAGIATRYSNTVAHDMIYAAVQLHNGDIVRLALPFAGVTTHIATVLTPLTLVVLGAAVLCLVVAWILSYWLKRDIEAMAHVVEAISFGKFHRRVHHYPGKEFHNFADAVNRMAQNIEEQINTVADQKEQLESILETMRDGVLVLGPQGCIRHYNRALLQAFPEAHTAIGGQIIEVIPDAHLQKTVEELLKQNETEGQDGYNTTCHVRTKYPTGRVFSVHLGRASLESPTLGAVAVFHDITEMVRLERVRRDFVANVSHELRTPLTAIQGYAETLATISDIPTLYRNFGEVIHKQASYLARIIDELLLLARLESEKMDMPLSACLAHESPQAALAQCQSLLASNNIQVAVHIPENIHIKANTAGLTQVFRNILENACHHAPHGSSITITAEHRQHEIYFAVADKGTGIPKADLPRIFERFYRVEKSRHGGSTGLGLSICRHIIEQHGGRIWAESPSGDYATAICFTLPTLGENHAS